MDRPPQCILFAPIDRDGRSAAALRFSLGGAWRATASDGLFEPGMIDPGGARHQLDVLLADQLVRDFAQDRNQLVRSSGLPLRSHQVGGRQGAIDLELCKARSTFDRLDQCRRIRLPEIARVLARRQRGDLDLDVESLLPLVPLLRRALAGGIGVVGQHHVPREALQDLDVVIRQRGPARRNDVRYARQSKPHDVGVALADDNFVPGADLGLGPVQAVEQSALVVQLGVLRVLVLRAVVAEGSTTEPDGISSTIEDREHQPRPEEVLRLLRSVHEGQPRGFEIIAAELQRIQVSDERVETVGRPTQAELPCRITVEATTPQVPTRVTARGVLQEKPVVKVDGRAHGLGQALALAAILGRAGGVVPQRDPGFGRESLDRVGELEALDLTDEGDGVAALLTPEAVVDAELRIDRETRRLLAVKGTETRKASAAPFERDVFADQRDDVGGLPNSCNVFFEDPHGRQGRGSVGVDSRSPTTTRGLIE